MHSVAQRVEAPPHWRPLVTVLTAGLGLIALVLAAVPSGTAAGADDGQAPAISDVALVKSSRTGEDSAGGLAVQDVAKLTYSWDAGSRARAGGTTTIDLGPHFTNLEAGFSAPMSVARDNRVEEVGTCDLTEKTITCTFNGKADELRSAGFTDFRGRGEALLLAAQQTGEATTTMTANGVDVAVSLPGEGGIKEAAAPADSPWQLSKEGSAIDSSSTDVTWRLDFGSDYVKEQLAEGDSAIAADGSTRDTITFNDTLGDGMSFGSDPSQWTLSARGPAGAEGTLLARGTADAGGADPGGSGSSSSSASSDAGGFNLVVTTRGQAATIRATGPFAPGTDYEIAYRTAFVSPTGKAVMGARYSNKATLHGAGKEVSSERSYVQPFRTTVGMASGFGGLEVVNALTGSAMDAVPAGTAFNVRVGYKLPEAAGAYTGWTAPGELSDDGVSGSAVMRSEIGRTTVFPGTFPKGTVVTLSEDLTSASPAPDGYSWGSPTYSVDGAETSSLTIGSQTSTSVSLTNRASATPLGTFQVQQKASGADVSGKEYSFVYECSDDQFGAVTVKGNDVAAAPDKTFAEGTSCTVKEDEEIAAIDGYDLSVPEERTVVITTGSTPTLTFTNIYLPAGTLPRTGPTEPAPTASAAGGTPAAQAAPASEDPGAAPAAPAKASLASTGAAVLVPLVIMVAALIGGAVMLLMRRRGPKDDDD
ncbi:DUF7926 domain-containing protein [Actinomyces israelii]|uniref:DUF7926 domain-containing protein n=1 Tax=Actinomyces israelii TaxID=1659 RepID=UPI000693FFAF|nr:DUF5979 domain-containing protein [Actinomyces israelii]